MTTDDVKLTAKVAEDAIHAHIGHRMRDRRRELKLTLKAVGDRVGLSPQQIQKYEQGANGASAGRLQLISQALQISPLYFFRGQNGARAVTGVGETEAAAFEYEAMSAGQRELVVMIGDLAPEAVQALTRLVGLLKTADPHRLRRHAADGGGRGGEASDGSGANGGRPVVQALGGPKT